MKNYAIILASGIGNRYGSEIPKQFSEFCGKTIFEHTIYAFEQSNKIDFIIVVVNSSFNDYAQNLISKNDFKKVLNVVNGGKTRKDSSFIGVSSIEENEANVLIHDCARPLISQDIISRCIEALEKHNAAAVAIPVSDTVIKVNDGYIENIPLRETLQYVQTPQCFKLSLIKKAHQLSINDNNFTDDCGLILKHNLSKIFVVKGEVENFKITYPIDIFIAEKIFSEMQNKNPD